MNSSVISCSLFENDEIPLCRFHLVARSSETASHQRRDFYIHNIDDLCSKDAWASCLRKLGNADICGPISRLQSDLIINMKDIGNQTCFAQLPQLDNNKLSITDSRKLEQESEAFLFDYYAMKATLPSQTQDAVDADGFILVRNDTKKSMANAKKIKVPDQRLESDFYKFQLKERKLTEWKQQKAEAEKASEQVGNMRKKRRFDL